MTNIQTIKIGVIGCGNMASALVQGMHKVYPEVAFITYTPSFTRAAVLAEAVQGTAVKTLKELEPASILMIACKPQQFKDLAKELVKEVLLKDKHLLSIMAAVSLKSIQNQLKTDAITRIMPNTPALLNQGISLIVHSSEVKLQPAALIEKLFAACGTVHLMHSEEQFDRVTTVSGCGPAYVFQFAQSLALQLEKWELSEQQSRTMINQLFIGAAKMMRANTEISLSALLDQVTSKGGVTIEAVKVYRDSDLDGISENALQMAYKRSCELTSEFN